MELEIRRDEALAQVAHPDLRALHDYWQAKHRGGRLPARSDIDPLDLRYIIGNLILLDVLRDPLRFRYRLVGSNLTRFVRFEMTGRMLDEHPEPTFRRLAMEIYSEVAMTTLALSTRRDAVIDNRLRRYETIVLPLAADGHTVDMILVGIRFED